MSETEALPAVSAARFAEVFARVRDEVERVVVGQRPAIERVLMAVFSGGHVLLTGMPGLGRTLLVNSIAKVLGLSSSRLQFTPDLLPTDILGTEILELDRARGTRHFRFFKGPVFANLVLADEVNRSPARTQAALLEVMQERQVTVGGRQYPVPSPFIIIATQNTVDTEGVWPMPEAQTDRFMVSIELPYPSAEQEMEVLQRTTGTGKVSLSQVTGPEEILAMQRLAAVVPVAPSVKEYTVGIVRASRPREAGSMPALEDRVRLGASPRAAQGMLMAGKVRALAQGRHYVIRRDVAEVCLPVMAHRLILDYRASAHGLTVAKVVQMLIEYVDEQSAPAATRRVRSLLKGRMAATSAGGERAALRLLRPRRAGRAER
jgi:MoxR-like ATPase